MLAKGTGDPAEKGPNGETLHRNVQHLQALVERVLKESEHIQTESGIKLARGSIYGRWSRPDSRPESRGGDRRTQLINQIGGIDRVRRCEFCSAGVQNLVANAIKYSPRGEIAIGARETGSGDAIECWVSDNGAGIPDDRLAAIFDKLTADPDKDGATGLGLTIVKAFVEAHGGKVTVESKVNVGSTFRFTLPQKGKATAGEPGA